MGFLPLPFPSPEGGGGASFNAVSCRPGEEKNLPRSLVVSCCVDFNGAGAEGVVQSVVVVHSFAFRGGMELDFVLTLFKL